MYSNVYPGEAEEIILMNLEKTLKNNWFIVDKVLRMKKINSLYNK
jgi:hypothetical protein